MTASALRGVLEAARSASANTKDQGDRFERLTAAALVGHEGPDGRGRFKKVWHWDDNWPGKTRTDGADTGIDLIAQQHDGQLCAIQCKFYKGEVSTSDVDSFLAASSRREFGSRALVHTGTGVQHHGANKLRQAHPPCEVFDVDRMGRWKIDWWKTAQRSRAVSPGTPRRNVGGKLSGPVAPARGAVRAVRRYWSSVGARWRRSAADTVSSTARVAARAWLAVESAAVSLIGAAVLAVGVALTAVLLTLALAAALAPSGGGKKKRGRKRRR